MNTPQFDATTELNNLRQYKLIRRKKKYQHSRLDKFRAELVQLRQAGASYRELALWLQREKNKRLCHSTIARYLVKLPELKTMTTDHAKFS